MSPHFALSRREFLRTVAALGVAYGARGFVTTAAWAEATGRVRRRPESLSDLESVVALAQGKGPGPNTEAALEALGGIGHFVRKGSFVAVKPNISWNRLPEQGANTNPEVVAAVVKACLRAGAGRVVVFDCTAEDSRRTYRRSGIAEAAEAAGARVEQVSASDFVEVPIPQGKSLTRWPFHRYAFEADVFINVPVAKGHNEAGLTIAMKNLMGVMGGERGDIHIDIHQKLVDVSTVIQPDLNIIDATRIMVAHGPQGTSPDDLRATDTIIAAVNQVTADAYAAQTLPFPSLPEGGLFGYIKAAGAMGLGETNLAKMTVRKA
jgi:uncharacterized protein (DUF362 family)